MRRRTWLLAIAACLLPVGLRADIPKGQLDASDVIADWSPQIQPGKDYQSFDCSPEKTPGVAANSFRIEGLSFEDLWNHYAGRCGLVERYKAKTFLVTSRAGDEGRCVVIDRVASRERVDRGPSVFLLKTDRYSVTVTIQPDPEGKAILGTIAAVVP